MHPCRYLLSEKVYESHKTMSSVASLTFFSSFLSHSVPKALSAMAVSDSDEEDQESTPVITNGDSAGSGAKPTAPMPETSAENGKL